MSIHGVLGESTSYPKTYQPDTLYPIARSQGRDAIGWQHDKLAQGVDWWHAFEVSWLNSLGISQVAIARFSIPANSINIVESKSLKLYLNSLNFTEFSDRQAVQQTIAKDLSACVGAEVGVELFDLESLGAKREFMISEPQGDCIDNVMQDSKTRLALVAHPDAGLLVSDKQKQVATTDSHYQFYSRLLRSNCPVTNQPDWGTVAIEMSTSVHVCKKDLLAYILSFRQHNGFHEQCVEQIFADISRAFNPSKLMVRAWYTRRGGIDINPCRVSHMSLLPTASRLLRQ